MGRESVHLRDISKTSQLKLCWRCRCGHVGQCFLRRKLGEVLHIVQGAQQFWIHTCCRLHRADGYQELAGFGFGLSPILSNETIVKMFARETPLLHGLIRDFFPQKGVTLCRDSCMFLKSTLLYNKTTPSCYSFTLSTKTLFLVSYSQKFFKCGPDLFFNIQR